MSLYPVPEVNGFYGHVDNTGTEWSESYDDVMPGSFAVSNGGDLLFGVSPYFEGETGTYLLDIQVGRSEIVDVDLIEESYLKVYPNPASDILNIEATDIIDRIELFDVNGRMIEIIDKESPNSSLDISHLDAGIYFVYISQQKITSVFKIVKL